MILSWQIVANPSTVFMNIGKSLLSSKCFKYVDYTLSAPSLTSLVKTGALYSKERFEIFCRIGPAISESQLEYF